LGSQSHWWAANCGALKNEERRMKKGKNEEQGQWTVINGQ